MNYLFTVIWVVDVICWWRCEDLQVEQPGIVRWGLHAFFAFMIFNATVVFGPPFWKPIGLLAAFALVWLGWVRPRALSKRETWEHSDS